MTTPAQTPNLQDGESLGEPISHPALNDGESLGAPVAAPASPNLTSNQPPQDNPIAQHGLLRRAWDFINSPIADISIAGHRILPEGVKTSDIVKAAAFEKMYGEAYIPGFNDFDTKAESHFGSTPAKVTTKDGHPYVAPPETHAFKNAVRTFISGAGKDTSDMAAGFTSPVGIATTLAGVGPEAKAGSALAKIAPIAKILAGTAFGAKGVHDIYAAGTENTPEAWQQRLQGAAMATGGAAALAEPVAAVGSKVSPKVQGAAETVTNAVKGGQPRLQTAIRGAAETAEETSAARPTPENVADKFPVRMEHDADGNVVDFDGRHRVLVALERGDETIPVRTTLADGTTETMNQSPQVVAEKMGLGKTVQEVRDSIAATDEQQGAVRAGNLQPREPVLEKVPAEPETPRVPSGGVRTAIEDVSNDVQARGQKIYKQLDAASGGRFQRYADTLEKINDQLDNLVEGVDDDRIESLEQKKNEIETSQAQMFDDLKNTRGLDPDAVQTANDHWKQSMALKDLDRAVKTSTIGEARIGGKEVVNPKMLQTRVQKLYDSGRLKQALGAEGADTLLKEAYAAKNARNLRLMIAGIAGLAAAYAGQGHLFGVAKTAAEAAVP